MDAVWPAPRYVAVCAREEWRMILLRQAAGGREREVSTSSHATAHRDATQAYHSYRLIDNAHIRSTARDVVGVAFVYAIAFWGVDEVARHCSLPAPSRAPTRVSERCAHCAPVSRHRVWPGGGSRREMQMLLAVYTGP